MKETEIKLLAELLKNSKKSDRELAKVLGVSQATASRTRSKLERDRVIQEYTVIPDLTKLGFELMAITTCKFKAPRNDKFIERGIAYMKKYPNVLFSSRAQGMGKDAVIVSLHKDFTDYNTFMVTLKSDWIDAAEDLDGILVSLKGYIVKPFSLKNKFIAF